MNVGILISDTFMQEYIFSQLDKCLDFFFATVKENATEHCFIIIGKSCLSLDVIRVKSRLVIEILLKV